MTIQKLYNEVEYDSETGFVTEAEEVTDVFGTPDVDGFDVNAGLKDAKVTQKAGVITVYDNGVEGNASKYYMADDFTIFVIEDKDDVSTVTAKKLANDYKNGGLDATIYGVMNSNDEYTALYIVK